MKSLCFPIIFIFIVFHSFAQNPTNGLLAQWKFDNNLLHATKNQLDAANNSGVTTRFVSDRKGNANMALRMDSAQIHVPYNPLFDFDSTEVFSFSLWLLAGSDGCFTSAVFVKAANNIGDFYCSGINQSNYAIFLQNVTINNTTSNSYLTTNIDNCSNTTNSSLFSTDNSWHHIAYVHRLDTIYAYVDARMVSKQKSSLTKNNFPLWISLNNRKSLQCFKNQIGGLDDLLLYNRALSQSEITNIVNGTVTANNDNSITSVKMVSVSPNPNSNGQFSIHSSIPVKKVEVLDMAGNIKESNSSSTIIGLSSGVYFFRVYTEYGVEILKAIVQ